MIAKAVEKKAGHPSTKNTSQTRATRLFGHVLKAVRAGVGARVGKVHGANHEPDGEALRQLGEEVGATAASKDALAGTAAKRASHAAALARLQQDNEHQHDGDEDVDDLDEQIHLS